MVKDFILWLSGIFTVFIVSQVCRKLDLKPDKIFDLFLSFFVKVKKDNYSFFSIGYLRTRLFVLQGDGNMKYSRNSIRCFYSDFTPKSPDNIADRILEKDRLLERLHEEGKKDLWDGVGVGLTDFKINLDEKEKILGIDVEFYKSRYAAFLATVVEIGKETSSPGPKPIFDEYLNNKQPDYVCDYLARHVGVACLVITSDNYIIFSERSDNSGARPGQFDLSFVEGIEPTKDCDARHKKNRIDVYNTIQRGCLEELGFKPAIREIGVYGFAVDWSFYQFNFLAIIRSSLTYEEIAAMRNGRASGSWELRKIHAIPYADISCLEFMYRNKMWAFCHVLVYWALIQKHPKSTVDARAFQIFSQKTDV